jgi:hypothetical protein
MEVIWQVSDGYVNNGPHKLKIDESEIIDCGDVALAMAMIDDAVSDAFQQTASASYDEESVRREVEKLLKEKGDICHE